MRRLSSAAKPRDEMWRTLLIARLRTGYRERRIVVEPQPRVAAVQRHRA